MNTNEMLESLNALIAIKSTKAEPLPMKPFGEEIDKALKFMLELGVKFGFKAVNVGGYAGYVEIGSGKSMVAALCHLDVVPAGAGWTTNPFEAIVKQGRIYGRGTLDDKGPAIAVLYAMKEIYENELLNPEIKGGACSRIRLILGLDEENGSSCMDKYLETEEYPVYGFVPDGNFPVINGEKGILQLSLSKRFPLTIKPVKIISMSGGDMPNMIPGKCTVTIQFSAEYEKVLLSGLEEIACESRSVEYEVSSDPDESDGMKKLVVRVTGKTAHASLPDDGDNAILKAGKLIKQIFDNINIQDEFIDFFARRFGDKTDGSLYGCALYDKLSGALTFSSGIINMSEGNLEIIVDIRYPVSYCEVDVLKKISGTSEIEGVQIKRINGMAPIYFPEDHPFVLHLSNTYNTVTGDHAKPLTTGGGTYARKMPNTLAFGPVFPGKEEVFHVAGEYIDIEDLNICAKIYKEALLKISQLAYQNETVKEN